jgi:peptidoglycan/LPS O-acetylase OafA/YrhL
VASQGLPTRDRAFALGVLSLTSAVAGVILLPVLFPDASVLFGFIGVLLGGLAVTRARSLRARTMAIAGIVVGVTLLVVAAVSVVTGNETQTGGGTAAPVAMVQSPDMARR